MMKWFALSLFVTGLVGVADAAPSPSPNFIFVLVDDQSWSGTPVAMMPGKNFSRTPGVHMPNVDRLATHGMIFSQAYASHSKCECSRASIQMGCTTISLNATDKWARNWNMPASDSLANTLKRANPSYRAAHFGKWQWPQTPESFGFDSSDGVTQNADGESRDPNDPKQSFSVTRRAQAYMKKQVKERHPFYLQLSYYAVHGPAQALASTLKKYESTGGGGGGKGGKGGGRDGPALAMAMAEDLDTCIGAVLKSLDELGIANSTYLVYMGDNGMASEALKGDKATVDEAGIRVPLIVAGPGIRGGVYCNQPVVGYDIFPTLLDIAAPGFTLPKGIEGGSWKPVLLNAGNGAVQRPIDRMVFHIDLEVDHPQTALRKGNLKLLHYWDTKENFLYDLSADLGERHNLAGEKPEVTAQLLAELKAHVRAGFGEQKFAVLESGKVPQPDDRRGGEKGKGNKGNKGGKGGGTGGQGIGGGGRRGDDSNRLGGQNP
jgi:arylsulfatase A